MWRRLALPVACLWFAASSAQAVDWTALKPQGYTSEFANVIDAESRGAGIMAPGSKATGAQMAFVTVPSLEGEPLEDVANDLFHAWGIGQKGQDNGVLFLLVTQDRRSRLEVGHGLEEILPDGFDGLLLDNMRPALRAGEYGQAMVTAAQAIGEVIAKAKNVTVAAPDRRAPRSVSARHSRGRQKEVPWIPILSGCSFLDAAPLERAGRRRRWRLPNRDAAGESAEQFVIRGTGRRWIRRLRFGRLERRVRRIRGR